MTTQIEMVRSGLLVDGEIRRQGEVIVKPDSLPSTPHEQLNRWNKVFYIEVGSKYDDITLKKQLVKEEKNILADFEINVKPTLTEKGKKLLEDEDDNPTPVDDFELRQKAEGQAPPDYFEKQEEGPEDEVEDAKGVSVTTKQIEAMKRSQLNQLVEDMGLDVPANKKKSVKIFRKAVIEELDL